MAFWQVKSRPYAHIEWGSCEVHAVVNAVFSADVYVVEADEDGVRELQQRNKALIVEPARDGTYRDVQDNTAIRVSDNGTRLEWVSAPESGFGDPGVG
jgi:hypothetical protein